MNLWANNFYLSVYPDLIVMAGLTAYGTIMTCGSLLLSKHIDSIDQIGSDKKSLESKVGITATPSRPYIRTNNSGLLK